MTADPGASPGAGLPDANALGTLGLQAFGLHLDDRAELVAMASIGLAVRLWRNTEIEDVHDGAAGRWRLRALEQAELDESVLERAWRRWRTAADRHSEGLNDHMTLLQDHPEIAEAPRLELARAGTRVGYGIPDDVMFRMNASTVAGVAGFVRELIDAPPADGDWIIQAAVRLWHPDREIEVGDAVWMVSDVFEALGMDPWAGELPEQVEDAIGRLSGLHEFLGFETTLRVVALTGACLASHWAGTPWWPATVARLVAHQDDEGAPFTEWDARHLLATPASVSGPCAAKRVALHWSTKIEDEALDDFRSERRAAAGLPADLRVAIPGWIALGL